MHEPPITGNQAIDEALARVAETAPIEDGVKAQLLSDAQAVLQEVLRASREEAAVAAER